MRKERWIIDEEEIAFLERCEGIARGQTHEDYMRCSKDGLATLCVLKDRSNDLFFRRAEAARAVIDVIAKQVGVYDNGFWLYALDEDGTTPITRQIEEWVSRSGEKAQLKRRVQDLEKENAILRSLLQK